MHIVLYHHQAWATWAPTAWASRLGRSRSTRPWAACRQSAGWCVRLTLMLMVGSMDCVRWIELNFCFFSSKTGGVAGHGHQQRGAAGGPGVHRAAAEARPHAGIHCRSIGSAQSQSPLDRIDRPTDRLTPKHGTSTDTHGQAYDELVAEFMDAAKAVWGEGVLLQVSRSLVCLLSLPFFVCSTSYMPHTHAHTVRRFRQCERVQAARAHEGHELLLQR